MAVYSDVPPPPPEPAPGNTASQQHTPSAASTVDIEAWTLSALSALSVSSIARGTGTPLSIPIDDHEPSSGLRLPPSSAPAGGPPKPPRRPPSRRDSQRRREAVLKGNEGSRQRRRWENGAGTLSCERAARVSPTVPIEG